MNRFAKKLTATAAALALLLTVPAAAAPSFVVFAEEEVQETESSKATKPTETSKPKETVKETKAASKPSETVKETEPSKPSETAKPVESSKPAETTKETESSKPAETTKSTEPSDTSKKEEPEETTAPSEPSETKEANEPEETKETEEATEPSETTAGETEPTESSEPSETTEPDATETVKPSHAAKVAARGQYSGINIDGKFSDWDSVVKYDFLQAENSNVNYAAIVWDGDWIYIYLDEVQQNSATWSGPERYGDFVITTDVGYDLMVSLRNNGANGNKVLVTNKKLGKELTSENGGIKVAFNSDYATWGKPTLTEIAIPTSILPDYISKISFGYYLGKPVIKNVANLHPVVDQDDPHAHDENDGSKIKIDGDYRDWKNFPHQTIEYDKNGPQHNYADAHGAIYQKDAKTVYVHGFTNDFDPPFAWYDGNQFLEVTLTLGGRTTKMIGCLIGKDGSIDWDASRQDRHYAPGTYKFALFDPNGNHATTNIKNIDPGDYFYGYQYLTVGEHVDETEFYIDTETLAKKLHLSLSQSAELKVYFHRVGKEPLIASGISTGPIFVLALTSVAAGSYYVFTRRKRRQA
ncbi:MAG: hypothetical protein J5623_09020 [Clostridiales bacterium]|nr:hypothetical protein [Clostridiales bacterium]